MCVCVCVKHRTFRNHVSHLSLLRYYCYIYMQCHVTGRLLLGSLSSFLSILCVISNIYFLHLHVSGQLVVGKISSLQLPKGFLFCGVCTCHSCYNQMYQLHFLNTNILVCILTLCIETFCQFLKFTLKETLHETKIVSAELTLDLLTERRYIFLYFI